MESSAQRSTSAPRRRPTGIRWLVYWSGRGLQVIGLLLLWWVLLLFADTNGMAVLLQLSLIAAVVFYAGWVCTVWARKGC
jgi:hypothetical protein